MNEWERAVANRHGLAGKRFDSREDAWARIVAQDENGTMREVRFTCEGLTFAWRAHFDTQGFRTEPYSFLGVASPEA